MEKTKLRNSSFDLTAQPSAAGSARHHATITLYKWSYPNDLIETVKLLVSELATNAVLHGQPDETADQDADLLPPVAGLFRLRLAELGDGGIRIEVRDTNPQAPVRRDASPEDVDGRGLALVEAMSRDWGYRWARSVGVKVVWCEVSHEPHAEA